MVVLPASVSSARQIVDFIDRRPYVDYVAHIPVHKVGQGRLFPIEPTAHPTS